MLLCGSGFLREQPSVPSEAQPCTEPKEGPSSFSTIHTAPPWDLDTLASSLLALSKARVEGRGLAGGQQAVCQGLETPAGGGRCSVPFPQHEMPKGLGWRDDGTYPQLGPQLKQ